MIIQKENKMLRQIAETVPVSQITSPKIQKVLKNMREALTSQYDGVAIAAPQIGVSLRIFIVSGRIFLPEFIQGKELETISEPENIKHFIFINPKIKKLSRKTDFMPEGCLSVKWLYGKVRRSTNATIEAYDEKGKKFVRGAGGLLAQIFQHETDHLNGVLFIDKAKDIKEELPKNFK